MIWHDDNNSLNTYTYGHIWRKYAKVQKVLLNFVDSSSFCSYFQNPSNAVFFYYYFMVKNGGKVFDREYKENAAVVRLPWICYQEKGEDPMFSQNI